MPEDVHQAIRIWLPQAAELMLASGSISDLEIHKPQDRIGFPAVRFAAEKLLQSLKTESFRSAITEMLDETNSKRDAD